MAEKKHDDLSMQIQKVIDDYVKAHRRYYCSLLGATPSEEVALTYDAEAIGDFIADAEMKANIPDDMSMVFTRSFNDSLNAHLNDEYADILNDAEAPMRSTIAGLTSSTSRGMRHVPAGNAMW